MIRRLLVLLIVAAAVYYGWKNYRGLMSSLNTKTGDVVVVNHSGHPVERIRISNGGRTEVVETLEDGATAQVAFQPPSDGTFHLVWKYRDLLGEREWDGGTATPSQVMTNRFEFTGESNVTWSGRPKGQP